MDTLERLEAVGRRQFNACPYGDPAVRIPPSIILVNAKDGLEPTIKICDLVKFIRELVQ